MFTVTVGLLWSGKRSTRSPLPSRYSVIPSTSVTLTGAGSAGTVSVIVFCTGLIDDLAGVLAAGCCACTAGPRGAVSSTLATSSEPAARRNGREYDMISPGK